MVLPKYLLIVEGMLESEFFGWSSVQKSRAVESQLGKNVGRRLLVEAAHFLGIENDRKAESFVLRTVESLLPLARPPVESSLLKETTYWKDFAEKGHTSFGNRVFRSVARSRISIQYLFDGYGKMHECYKKKGDHIVPARVELEFLMQHDDYFFPPSRSHKQVFSMAPGEMRELRIRSRLGPAEVRVKTDIKTGRDDHECRDGLKLIDSTDGTVLAKIKAREGFNYFNLP